MRLWLLWCWFFVESGGQELAMYRVTFQADWTEARFPKHYPKWRPHAQWSTLIGRSHSPSYRLWRVGGLASEGVKQYTRTGRLELLVGEQGGGVLDEFYGPPVNQGAGTSQAHFFVDHNHTRVSLLVRMVPSPDWFVGVDGLELCRKTEASPKRWLRNLSVDSDPVDAGTDNGFTFTSPSWETEPRARMSRITAQSPSHPANSFYYPHWKKLPRLAHFRFTLLKVFRGGKEEINTLEHRRQRLGMIGSESPIVTEVHFVKQEDNQELRKKSLLKPTIQYQDHHINTIQHNNFQLNKKLKKRGRSCKVSEWSEWSPCSRTCGFGESFRSRGIVKQTPAYPCPPIRESRWCGSTRKCRSPTGYFVW